jgi:hypothetical protein
MTTKSAKSTPTINHAAFACLGVWIALLIVLALPTRLPIGAMYWDNAIYYDGAMRVLAGQVPSVDFFAPAGPLSYWLSAVLFWLFPGGQSVLVASWSLALVSLPLMAVTAFEIGKTKPGIAWALTAVFLIYTVLPFNTTPYSSFPGADGFAIYNRHGSQGLLLLASILLFVKTRRILVALIAATMLVLFLTKITAFLSGGFLCLFALIVGRVTIREALVTAALFAGVLGLTELASGAISGYLANIATLATMNSDSLLPRLLQAVSRTFSTGLAAGLLALALLVFEGPRLHKKWREAKQEKWSATQKLLDQPFMWIGVLALAGILFESQNTGGQEMVFLWPAVLMVLLRLTSFMMQPARLAVVALLAGLAVLPPLAATVQASVRAVVGMATDIALDDDALGPLGRVTMRPAMAARAEFMRGVYLDNAPLLKRFADNDQIPSPSLFADFDFQILWLKEVSAAVSALKQRERDGYPFQSVMTLNFANPFPGLLGKSAPKYIAIGADPGRAVPPLDERTAQSIRDTDIVLVPLCPYTAATRALETIYATALADRRTEPLTACYDMLLN